MSKEKKSILVTAFIHTALATIVFICLISLNACYIIAYYPENAAYPTAETQAYYADLNYTPVYGVGIYANLGSHYPYYYYYGGYRSYLYGHYYYRYYRIWTWDSVPYYWNNGNYAPIYETSYYSYDVTVNNWYSAPLPQDTHVYGTPPKPFSDHPQVQGIPKSADSGVSFDSEAYPPSAIGNGEGVPKPPEPDSGITISPIDSGKLILPKDMAQKFSFPSGKKVTITQISPGAMPKKPVAPVTPKPGVGGPKISGMSPSVMQKKPVGQKFSLQPSGHSPKISGVSPAVMPKKPVQPIVGASKIAPKVSGVSPSAMPSKPVKPASNISKPASKSFAPKPYVSKAKPFNSYKPAQKNFGPSYAPKPAKSAPSKFISPKKVSPKVSPKIYPKAKIKH